MEKEFVDYYKILGVTFGATEEQLKNAYRNLAKRLHPDTYQGNMSKEREEELTIRFKYVNEAYHVLINPQNRAQYDVEYIIEQEKIKEQARIREERRKEQEARRQERIRREQEEARARAEKQNMEQEQVEVDEQSIKENMIEDGFFKQVKKSYDEVRKDEKRMSFTKRHKRISKSINKNLPDDLDLGEEIIVVLKNGILHVGLEFFYQLDKLGRINSDTVTKYLIRNRKTIAAVIIAGTIFSASSKNSNDELHVEVEDIPSVTTTTTPSEEVKDENIKLVRYHKVSVGDTLSGLSNESNTTIESIKKANGLTSSTIYVGQELKIPYYIKEYELDYFTESYNVENQTLSQIAESKHTDVATLLRLNEESIIKTESGDYIILSNSILVPNFITREELYDLKESRRNS